MVTRNISGARDRAVDSSISPPGGQTAHELLKLRLPRKEQERMQAALAALEAASRAKEADMVALQDGGSRVGALKQVTSSEAVCSGAQAMQAIH